MFTTQLCNVIRHTAAAQIKNHFIHATDWWKQCNRCQCGSPYRTSRHNWIDCNNSNSWQGAEACRQICFTEFFPINAELRSINSAFLLLSLFIVYILLILESVFLIIIKWYLDLQLLLYPRCQIQQQVRVLHHNDTCTLEQSCDILFHFYEQVIRLYIAKNIIFLHVFIIT